jgi:hypothetical protein
MFEFIKYSLELRKLEREYSRIDREYSTQKKGLSSEELQNLHAEESSVVWPVLEKIDQLNSRRFCHIANKLMVPLPDRNDKEMWQEQPLSRKRILSSKGIWELKKLIRQEKRERREGFVVWLAALTGFFGAITGLAAILSR